MEAIEAAGLTPGKQVAIALDPAASAFRSGGRYHLVKSGVGWMTTAELASLYASWVDKYPIVSI